MRTITAILALATVLIGTATIAAPAPSAKTSALQVGDWRRAAELGASAADVVRALQAKGRLPDMAPEETVVTIGSDNGVDAVALKPLPPLDPADVARKDVRTVGLSGIGFAFTAKPGSIILYPAYATQTFALGGPAPTNGLRP